MTTMHETVMDALRASRDFIIERDKDHPVHHKLDAAFAVLAEDANRREAYMPTMDEACRFIKSNPLTSAEILGCAATKETQPCK